MENSRDDLKNPAKPVFAFVVNYSLCFNCQQLHKHLTFDEGYICNMLTPDEERFLLYWEHNRTREKSIFRQLSLGLPLGLVMGIAILLNFVSGWYTRATMVAYSQSTPIVLIIAIFIIAVFCSVFYKRHRWEMNEQHYMELQQKKAKHNTGTKQHNDTNESQRG